MGVETAVRRDTTANNTTARRDTTDSSESLGSTSLSDKENIEVESFFKAIFRSELSPSKNNLQMKVHFKSNVKIKSKCMASVSMSIYLKILFNFFNVIYI